MTATFARGNTAPRQWSLKFAGWIGILLGFTAARLVLLATIFFALSVAVSGQTTPGPSRITRPVDDNDLVELKGNTRPLAHPQFDQGGAGRFAHGPHVAAPDAHQGTGGRSNRLVEDQQNANSPNFHKWLSPEQYGEQFGPTPEEIQTVTGWLQSHGFSVAHVADLDSDSGQEPVRKIHGELDVGYAPVLSREPIRRAFPLL